MVDYFLRLYSERGVPANNPYPLEWNNFEPLGFEFKGIWDGILTSEIIPRETTLWDVSGTLVLSKTEENQVTLQVKDADGQIYWEKIIGTVGEAGTQTVELNNEPLMLTANIPVAFFLIAEGDGWASVSPVELFIRKA